TELLHPGHYRLEIVQADGGKSGVHHHQYHVAVPSFCPQAALDVVADLRDLLHIAVGRFLECQTLYPSD
ncbi:MAG: hypothetical protein MUO89_04155, partial [Dehalococcoidia bacterium]|nr:hypothetical protein [Dehalococcoidia bacterium]